MARTATGSVGALITVLTLGGCASTQAPSIEDGPIGLVLVTDDLTRPVFVTSPADDPRLFVVEQDGRIVVLADGRPTTFLDISGLVSTQDNEQGLLGLAFHPDYGGNGRFFVSYTGTDDSVRIAEYRVSTDPGRAEPGSARVLVTIAKPTRRHNGGWIGFGPDGLLYATVGDGTNSAFGPDGDPFGYSQDPSTLLGTVFRLDVDRGDGPEVVAFGLRNPWRASFDGDRLWLGDVGQSDWEEIDNFVIGQMPNFGWNVTEGNHCFRGTCDPANYVPPVYEYSHDEGCSVTGGYVYRGSIASLRGQYFFADYCGGWVRSINDNGRILDWTVPLGGNGLITSFGVDSYGELYIVTQGGKLFRIVER